MNLSNQEIQELEKDFHLFASNNIKSKSKKREKKLRNKTEPLKPYFHNDKIEAGIDEAGRGPLFGRVYTAAVILPKEGFNHSIIKDSKRFSSKKKLLEVYNYIKENSISYSVCYKDEKDIDDMNILQATLNCMHDSINGLNIKPEFLLVDGNSFYPYPDIPHKCIEGGDNWYTPIAAASILAKVERDTYIEELCKKNPELTEKYGIDKNKGYGTKKHIDGIKEYGITKCHRKTFGICRNYS